MQPTNTFYGGGIGPQNYQTPKRKLSRRMLLIGFGVFAVVIVIILGILSASGGGSQSKLADDFVAKFVASDTEATYALFSPSTKRTESIDSWSTKVNLTKDFFEKYVRADVETDEIVETTTESQEATEVHTYMAKGSDGTYAFFVTVSKNKSDPGVISFESAPYADIRNVLK